MWEIYEHRRLVRRLPRIPAGMLKRYEKWKDIVRISGRAGLRTIKRLHDESLHGDWKGHRSTRLGIPCRIIYRIEAREILVLVIDITAHDCRRK